MTADDPYDILKTAELQNEIEKSELETQDPLQSILNDNERYKHDA